MNPYEEELQKAVENGRLAESSEDGKAYQAVFRALKKEPAYRLPAGFAERIVSTVAARKADGTSKDYFWFGAGLFVLTIAFVGTILYTGFRLDFGFLKGMSNYKGLAVFGIAFIIFLNFLDKKLVKEKQFHQKTGS
ncbi:MAG: hypothetical protein WA874_06160 [Chryseosolibacter sp.]